MPRTKPISQSARDDEAYTKAILMALAATGKTRQDLADLIGVTRKTVHSYITHPSGMRLTDLRIVRDFCRRSGVEWPVTV